MNIPEGKLNTLANAFTATGGALVGLGLNQGIETPTGLAMVAIGRGFDLIDGPTARLMNQASDFGAMLDASTDKFSCAAIALTLCVEKIVPKPVFVGMFVQNMANGVATYAAQRTHPDEKFLPSKVGKLSMFTQNIALMSYAYSHIYENKLKHLDADNETEQIKQYKQRMKIGRAIGHISSGVGVIGLGIPATWGYIQRAKPLALTQ